ncbi:hypothetical protein L1987_63622 [Smallanthus sonchifolius]|uniref:Uncharacterized protein n=1 Tax=Smallanthus sonchifolius TaxID=185202 RepID=A0ACB9CE47_9ASTR|nr:hypothetical protein L1987_63622 [Smallanthus sonchifolius]
MTLDEKRTNFFDGLTSGVEKVPVFGPGITSWKTGRFGADDGVWETSGLTVGGSDMLFSGPCESLGEKPKVSLHNLSYELLAKLLFERSLAISLNFQESSDLEGIW